MTRVVGEREERLRQRQDSVTEQLHDLTIVAERKGMYDAADWIKRQFQPRPCEQHQFSSSLTEMSECPDCVLPWRDLALASSPSPPDGSLNPHCVVPDCKVPASWLVAGKWYCGAHTRDLAQGYESHVIPGYVSALERVARERDSHAFGRPSPPDREQAVREALAELVRLKDDPRDEAYRAQKDAAWDAARKALASSRGDEE